MASIIAFLAMCYTSLERGECKLSFEPKNWSVCGHDDVELVLVAHLPEVPKVLIVGHQVGPQYYVFSSQMTIYMYKSLGLKC